MNDWLVQIVLSYVAALMAVKIVLTIKDNLTK